MRPRVGAEGGGKPGGREFFSLLGAITLGWYFVPAAGAAIVALFLPSRAPAQPRH